jgi:Undecaprenyl-phosphate glucose phosphotransferase
MNTTDMSLSEMSSLTLPYRGSRLQKRDFVSLASDLLPPCDFVCFLLAGFVGTLLYALFVPGAPLESAVAVSRGNVALIGAVLAPFFLYDGNFAAAVGRRHTSALIAMFGLRFVLIAAVALAIGTASQVFDNLPPSWVALWLGASLTLTALVRVVVVMNMRALNRRGAFTESVAIVGAGSVADRLNRHLRATKADRIELLGIFGDVPSGVAGSSTWPVGSIDELVELSKRRAIDWILVALPVVDEARLGAIVQRLEVLSVPIALCPPNVGLRRRGAMVEYTGSGMPVMLLADRPIKRWNAVLKSAEDVLLSRILLLLLLPLLGLIALAIKLDSPGPIVFKQRRHAFNNSEFDIYKFRTMRHNEDVSDDWLEQTARFDRRVTSVGRFLRSTSLDELPQLFNVLKGEMSLVGPRPHAVNMRTEDRLGSEITGKYAHRHRVKPGMTGWSQVNGARGATTTTAQLRHRVALDLMYVDNWSLWLDLKILVLTWRELLRRTNAY